MLSIALHLIRIQLTLVIWEIVVISQLAPYNKISALVLCAIVNSKLSILQRSEAVPQIANSFHAFFPSRPFNDLLSRFQQGVFRSLLTTEEDAHEFLVFFTWVSFHARVSHQRPRGDAG